MTSPTNSPPASPGDVRRSYPNTRDCEHGNLRRSCDRCDAERDLAEALATIAALQQRAQALEQARDVVSPTPEAREALAELIPIAERMLALLDNGETVAFDNYADADDAVRYAIAIDKARAVLGLAALTPPTPEKGA